MKRTSLKLLICLMTVLLFAGVLTACNKNNNTEKLFDYIVTFDYNEGNRVAEADRKKPQTLGVHNNGLVSIRPGYNDSFEESEFSTYYVEGWYLPKLNANGEVVVDENEIVELDREWDFKTDRVTEPITLYAKLGINSKLFYIDIATGEEVGSMQYAPGHKRTEPTSTSTMPSKRGYTFLGKYYDNADRSEIFEWPYVFTEEDKYVYVDMIEGIWKVVSTPGDFVSGIKASQNLYLTDDVDFANYTDNLWGQYNFGFAAYTNSGEYNGTINGNNHKVLNLSRKLFATQTNSDNLGGVFGSLGAKTNIYDISFVNVQVEYQVQQGFEQAGLHFGVFAWEAENGAKFSNVTLSGTMTYTKLNNRVIANRWISRDRTSNQDIVNVNYNGVAEVILPDPPASNPTSKGME